MSSFQKCGHKTTMHRRKNDKDNRSKSVYALTRTLNTIVISLFLDMLPTPFVYVCVRACACSFVTFDPRSVARSLQCWPCSVGRIFFSFILLLVRWHACSYIHSSSHLNIRWLAVSGDTFSSVANAVLEDLTMNALLTARVTGHRSGLPCLELYLVQGQQVSELE